MIGVALPALLLPYALPAEPVDVIVRPSTSAAWQETRPPKIQDSMSVAHLLGLVNMSGF